MASHPVPSVPTEEAELTFFEKLIGQRVPPMTPEEQKRLQKILSVDPAKGSVPSFSSADELEALLLEGVNSGPSIPVDDKFWAGHYDRVENQRASRKKAEATPA